MRFRFAALVTTFLLTATPAFPGQVWTDANGDGLPDDQAIFLLPSYLTTVDVWIDTQSFVFTSFRATVERSDLVETVAAGYWISGGSNAPIDMASRPSSLIYSGSGYSGHGITRIGWVTLHIVGVADCRVFLSPIIEPGDAFACRLSSGGGSQHFFFQTASGSYLYFSDLAPSGPCPPTATEHNSWGRVKAIFQ